MKIKKLFGVLGGAAVGVSALTLSVSADNEPATLISGMTNIDIPFWLFVLALFAVLFIGSNLAKKGEWQEDAFSLETTKYIRGFCAVGIIFHHLSQKIAEQTDRLDALGMFKDIGVVFVGIFFFFSGYGLFKSFKTKDNYLKGFFKKRMPAILVPFYMTSVIFVIYNAIIGENRGISELVWNLTGWHPVNSHSWYIVEIAVLYVIFYLIFRFISRENVAIAVMGIVSALLVVYSLLLGHDVFCRYWFMGEWWYNTTMLFFIGILFAKNEKRLVGFAKKCYKWLLPLSIVISGVLFYFTQYVLDNFSYWAEGNGYKGYTEKFICLGVQLPMVIFTTLTLVLIMLKLRFGNPILKFLGAVSLELYLIHNLFLTGLRDTIGSDGMYMLLTLVLSIAAAALLHVTDKFIISLFRKKRKQPSSKREP